MNDWALIRSFLSVAETGSLSAAARALGATQPTVGRHIKELENSMGQRLFHRLPRGLEPTEAALPLLAEAQRMAEAASVFSNGGRGSAAVQGTVRITASRMVACYMLPQIVTAIRIARPGLQIEIDATDTAQNLLRRDADIAIRMFEPGESDLVRRKIADVPLGLYGAASYFARHGRPAVAADLALHEFAGLDRSDELIRGFGQGGMKVDRSFFPVRCDDHVAVWQLVCAGAGLGFAQRQIGDAAPGLERLDLPDMRLPPLPAWAVMHKDVRTTPRLAYVADFLARELARMWRPADGDHAAR